MPPRRVWACLPPAIAATSVDAAVEELLAGRARVESPYVHLDLPQRFDYGNTVPLAVTVDSPMAEAEHVRRVHVFAAGNPSRRSRVFTSPRRTAAPALASRLNEGKQEVVAVAELSDGRTWLSRRAIEVAISGCSETGVAVGQLMPRPEPRLKLPAEARRDEIVEIRTMISHWMETGLRSDGRQSDPPPHHQQNGLSPRRRACLWPT